MSVVFSSCGFSRYQSTITGTAHFSLSSTLTAYTSSTRQASSSTLIGLCSRRSGSIQTQKWIRTIRLRSEGYEAQSLHNTRFQQSRPWVDQVGSTHRKFVLQCCPACLRWKSKQRWCLRRVLLRGATPSRSPRVRRGGGKPWRGLAAHPYIYQWVLISLTCSTSSRSRYCTSIIIRKHHYEASTTYHSNVRSRRKSEIIHTAPDILSHIHKVNQNAHFVVTSGLGGAAKSRRRDVRPKYDGSTVPRLRMAGHEVRRTLAGTARDRCAIEFRLQINARKRGIDEGL